MLKPFALVVPGSLVLAFGAATLAAPSQDRQPGIIRQPRVTVENRGRTEAIPVSIQDWPTAVIQARMVRQVWEYRTVRVALGQDLANAILGLGAEGWEATGVFATDAGATNLLMKRPLNQ